MSNVFDRVFAEVCLDERISDGIFRMEETEHMNALRDYFIKRGITKEDAVHVTNRMVEGKYPDRQAYRAEDGILVTWPSPKHKQKAMRENPRKYVEENPFPKKQAQEPKPEPAEREPRKEKDSPSPSFDAKQDSNQDSNSEERPGSSLFGGENGPKIQQGNSNLSIEPLQGTEQPKDISPPQPTTPPAPRTAARIAAEKEVVKQIMKTDDTTLSNVANPLNEAYRQKIIKELYIKADALGLTEVVTFLTPYVNL